MANYDDIFNASAQKDMEENLFINSDSQRDVAHLRKRYFAQKNDGN